jgi:hypothetical protein
MFSEVQGPREEWMDEPYDYAPDQWMLIQITGTDPHYRVFGSWSGSYLNGDSWRLNSGIKSVKQVGDYYFFYGHSGSVYRCHKEMYGSTPYVLSVAQGMAERSGATMYLMDEPEDILNFNWV